MSIPLISPNSVIPGIPQINAQIRADHSMIALAGQMGQQALKKSRTDTVTLSKKAIQMVSTTKQSNLQAAASEKAVDQAQSRK